MKERKKACKKPSLGDENKEQRKRSHQVKIAAKRKRDEYYHRQFGGYDIANANLGVNHPDWGMSVRHHLEAKERRQSEKSS